MRLRQIQDFLRRSGANERVKHVPLHRIAAPRRQFPVGKCARAALAELHVRLAVESAARPKFLDRRMACVNILPAL